MKTKFNGILTLMLALFVQITFAQEKTITGTVSDESGPLPGVSVLVKGTNTGTVTDFDGKYVLTVSEGTWVCGCALDLGGRGSGGAGVAHPTPPAPT